MRLLKIVFITYLTIGLTKSFAQDISFSQFNSLGSYYNPALTGSFDGNFKVRIINRDHWVKFADAPYRTFGISGDIKFDQSSKDFKGDFLALGAYFISDRGQILDWNKNEMGVSIAYHKLLDKIKKTYLSGGITLGILQRSISYDNIYFEDQFDGLDRYNGSTNEILPQNIHATPDQKSALIILPECQNCGPFRLGRECIISSGQIFHFTKALRISIIVEPRNPKHSSAQTPYLIFPINWITFVNSFQSFISPHKDLYKYYKPA